VALRPKAIGTDLPNLHKKFFSVGFSITQSFHSGSSSQQSESTIMPATGQVFPSANKLLLTYYATGYFLGL
jgi:hypothetical protein